MKTLCDQVDALLTRPGMRPLRELLELYEGEKDVAKCYSSFAYLSCSGAGGSVPLAEAMAELVEAFYLATSIHDDVLDREDEHVKRHRENVSPNTYMVLGDCFFVQIATALGRAAPLMPEASRECTLLRFQQTMLDVAESQVIDEHSRSSIPDREAAVEQMRIRGGTWGRLCIELPALAAGLADEDVEMLGAAGEDLFMGLTVRDDLRDLRDDLSNGILTLAPALMLEQSDSATRLDEPLEASQSEALIDLMMSEGAIAEALQAGQGYTRRAMQRLQAFLEPRDNMNWFLLQMIFRLTNKRIQEFTPEDVLRGQLGIGFSALNETLDADIDG